MKGRLKFNLPGEDSALNFSGMVRVGKITLFASLLFLLRLQMCGLFFVLLMLKTIFYLAKLNAKFVSKD